MRRSILAIYFFVGGFFPLYAQPDSIAVAVEKIKSAVQIINYTYVHAVDNRKLADEAIGAMLEELDPHSRYLTKEMYKMQEYTLSGKQVNIGIDFILLDGEYRVWHIDPEKISSTIGVEVGDKLLAVNGKSYTSFRTLNDLNSFFAQHAHNLLHLSLVSRKLSEEVNLSLHPELVSTTGIDTAEILQPGIGYIRIARFKKNTAEAFAKELSRLKKNNMQSLILDLRANQGGYFKAAIDIADQFLDAGKTIVYTKGESKQKEVFKSTPAGLFRKGKLIVMVDENSASASEIIAGAIQDLGRGIIAGRKTYGKALVQRDYFLKDSSVLRLSIAKYYTPSGRCIQKPYGNHKALRQTRKYLTENSRIVYGNGGIEPDRTIENKQGMFLTELKKRKFIDRFLLNEWTYVSRFVPPLTSLAAIRSYRLPKEVFNRFSHFLTQNNEFVGDKQFLQNRAAIMGLIKHSIISIACQPSLSRQYFIEQDSDIQYVESLLEDSAIFSFFNISY